MKIAIDARMYGKGYGIGRYVESLVHGLEKTVSDISFILYLKPESVNNYRQAGGSFEVIEAPYHWYGLDEQTKFLSLLNTGNHDLIHFPHWNIPVRYKRPFLVTIHDLTMFHFPRYEATTRSYPVFWVKDKIHRMVVRHAARHARAIIATSQFTAQDIISSLGVSQEKISVVYQSPNLMVENNWEEVRKKFGLEHPYLLYVGAAYPHKNLKKLLDAWKQVNQNFVEYELILAGSPSPFYVDIEKYIHTMNIPNVRLVGFVEDIYLNQLYHHASAMVFPSLYEGFGLPPLEAITAEVPVIASHAGSLPEILGEAAYYVDPNNAAHIAQGISEVLGNEEIKMELKKAGRIQASLFSEGQYIKNTLSVYKKALGESN